MTAFGVLPDLRWGPTLYVQYNSASMPLCCESLNSVTLLTESHEEHAFTIMTQLYVRLNEMHNDQ